MKERLQLNAIKGWSVIKDHCSQTVLVNVPLAIFVQIAIILVYRAHLDITVLVEAIKSRSSVQQAPSICITARKIAPCALSVDIAHLVACFYLCVVPRVIFATQRESPSHLSLAASG